MKILIIRFSSIGDIVLTTPVVRCLKKQMGEKVEIHYLTKENFRNILKANPYIDKIITMKKKLREILPELKQYNYDYIIDLHNNLRSTLVKKSLNKPAKSFNKLNLQKWLLVNFKINYLPDLHIVDRYMQTVDFLDVKYDGKGLDHFYDKSEQVQIRDLPNNFQNGYVALAIGGNHYTKKMTNEKIITICKKLNYPIFLLGGKEDKTNGDCIANNCFENVFNGCGKYSLNQSASLIEQSKAVITHDTGLMHIAAALRKPAVSVWGNTDPSFGMYPLFPIDTPEYFSKIVEIKNLSCRPCSKIGHSRCPKKHFRCIEEINENEIVEFVKKHL